MEYTTFAIVTIESLWPSPTSTSKEVGGGEIGKAGDIKDTSTYKGEVRGRVGSNDNSYYNTASSEFSRGYYIIVALNVTNLNTSSTVTGSNSFNLSFTPDKIIYIDQNMGTTTIEELIRAAIAKPDASGNILHESFSNSLSEQLINKLKTTSGVQYTEIPVGSGNFNIKDIIEIGDTVSIWLYNDPSEFPVRIEYYQGNQGKVKDMQAITGSHTRRMPIVASDDVMDYSVSSYTNITNRSQANAVNAASGKKNRSISVSFDDVKAAAIDIAVRAGGYLDQDGNRDAIQTYALTAVSDALTSEKGINYRFKNLNISAVDLIGYYLSDVMGTSYVTYHKDQLLESAASDDSGKDYKANEAPKSQKLDIKGNIYSYNPAVSSTMKPMLYFISKMYQLQGALDDTKVFFEKGNGVRVNKDAQNLDIGFILESKTLNARRRPSEFASSVFDSALFVQGYHALRSQLMNLAKAEAEGAKEAVAYNAVNPKKAIDRASLYSPISGDTPYLIMRGHIKQASSTHSVQGVNINISGSGYEYPMEKHTVFYDDVQTFAGGLISFQDYTSYYASLKPPQVIIAFLTKWMPKKVKWGRASKSHNTQTKLAGVKLDSKTETSYLVRGSTVFERNRKSLLYKTEDIEENVEDYDNKAKALQEFRENEIKNDSRVFTPINYVDLTRVAEFTRALDRADPSGLIATSTVPTTIQTRDTIMSACKKVANVSNLYELFVDETGRLIYRAAPEAWERTPKTSYIPTIESDSVLSFTEVESDESIFTVFDIQPTGNASLGAGTSQLTRYNWGRAIPRSGYVPIDADSKDSVPNMFSPELFRYGMRYQYINDHYGVHNDVMRPKAYNLLRFYKTPLKKGEVTVIADPTYRAGNTVLVTLKDRKTRSKAVIDIDATIKWLESMPDDGLERYVGVEERLVDWTRYYTNNEMDRELFGDKAYTSALGGALSLNTVRKAIVNTLKLIKSDEYGGHTHITADMFPTTLWFYLSQTGTSDSKAANVVKAYKAALKYAKTNDASVFSRDIIPYLRYVEFNTFISRQY